MTEIKKAGPLGRLVRLLLGVATLSLFAALVGPLRAALWFGEVPAHWSFYIALGFGLYLTSFVARILANRAWSQKPLVVALLGAGIHAATTATAICTTAASSKLAGSVAEISTRCASRKHVNTIAAPRPPRTLIDASTSVRATTRRPTAVGGAPIAMWIPMLARKRALTAKTPSSVSANRIGATALPT